MPCYFLLASMFRLSDDQFYVWNTVMETDHNLN